MPRQLLLFRHAKSDWATPDLDDYDRPLSPRGRSAAPRMGKAMRRQGLDPRRVLCSTAARAQQTLLLALEELGWRREVVLSRALYLAEWPALLAILAEQPEEIESVMLIGHNPGMEQLASVLAHPELGDVGALERLKFKFPTAAIAELDLEGPWSSLAPQSCALTRFVTPAEFT